MNCSELQAAGVEWIWEEAEESATLHHAQYKYLHINPHNAPVK